MKIQILKMGLGKFQTHRLGQECDRAPQQKKEHSPIRQSATAEFIFSSEGIGGSRE